MCNGYFSLFSYGHFILSIEHVFLVLSKFYYRFNLLLLWARRITFAVYFRTADRSNFVKSFLKVCNFIISLILYIYWQLLCLLDVFLFLNFLLNRLLFVSGNSFHRRLLYWLDFNPRGTNFRHNSLIRVEILVLLAPGFDLVFSECRPPTDHQTYFFLLEDRRLC